MSLIFHETTSFVSHAYAIKWSDPVDNGMYSRMLRVWPYSRISYITFNTILCFKILPMCVGSFFSLDKSKDNFISCYVCDAKFVRHVVYFVHWK